MEQVQNLSINPHTNHVKCGGFSCSVRLCVCLVVYVAHGAKKKVVDTLAAELQLSDLTAGFFGP